MYRNPLTELLLSYSPTDCIPESGAGEGAEACCGDHDIQAKPAFCRHKARQGNDQFVVVIHSNIDAVQP
jgi:hypothetical protein